jgi:hypothetical protein
MDISALMGYAGAVFPFETGVDAFEFLNNLFQVSNRFKKSDWYENRLLTLNGNSLNDTK